MMKRLVSVLFFLLLGVFALALVAPSFINWNQHKERVAAVIEAKVRRDITISGDVSFRILPQPRITAADVTVANADGAEAEFFMKLRLLDARVKLGPLLEGRVEIEDVSFIEPELSLEVMADGVPNWAALLKENDGKGLGPAAVSLNSVRVTDGTVHYLNQPLGIETTVKVPALDVSAATLLGPYSVSGVVSRDGNDFRLRGSAGARKAGAPVPVKLAVEPGGDGLPGITFDGTAVPGDDFALQGSLSVEGGPLAPLLGNDFLSRIPALQAPAALDAALAVRGGEISFADIKGTLGAGNIGGKVVVLLEKGKKPAVMAELEGASLVVSDGPMFLTVPGSFSASLKLQGKDITWQGAKVAAVSLSMDVDDKDWILKSLRAELPGKSDVRLAGIITSHSKYEALNINLDTEDFSALVQSPLFAPDNALKVLPLKKVSLTASLNGRPENLNITDISATIADKVKATGTVNVARGAGKPAFDAGLEIAGWDSAVMPQGLLQALGRAEGGLDLRFTDFTRGDLKVKEMKVVAQAGPAGLVIKDVTATVNENEGFDFSGAVRPSGAFDIAYNVKAADGAAFAKALGFALPPPLGGWKNAAVHGKVAGEPSKYAFTIDGSVNGGTVALNGAFENGTYGAALKLSRRAEGDVLGMMGLPIERLLVAQNGDFDFSGTLKGTAGDYTIENISTRLGNAPLSGTLAKRGGAFTADLSADTIDFDNWLWSDWSVREGMTLDLKGKTLVWRDTVIENPVLRVEAGPSSIAIPKLTGKLWGGEVDAAVLSERKDGAWQGTLKGKLAGADLDKLRELLEADGFELGRGDLTFDLTSTGSTFLDGFASISGVINLGLKSLTIDRFNPAAAATALNGTSSIGLQQRISHAMKEQGSGTYKDVAIPLKIGGGAVTVENLVLKGEGHTATVSLKLDLGPYTYDLTAKIQPDGPKGVPAFTVRRADDVKKADGDYAVDISGLESWHANRNPVPAILPEDPLKGIMQRLEE